MLKRKITAIMAADIAEYTRIIAEDEEEGLARLESYRRVFDDFVARSGGRVFNSGGDSVMCEFPSAVEATRCAIDIQESLRTRNRGLPANRQMHYRIGITIGDVVERDGDLLGDGVNVAARLQALAEPGSICVARNVQEAVSNKISVPFRDLGHREVKNLPHPVHAFQIEMGGTKISGTPKPARPSPAGDGGARLSRRAAALWLLAGLVIAGSGAGLYWLGRADQANTPAIAVAPIQPDSPPETPSQLPAPAQPNPGERIVITENLSPAQVFERLAKSGGLVGNPANAPELYHNARLFEARGEGANARRDYLALAALGTDYIDPLLRLAALIRAQDGRAGAREIFADIARSEPGRSTGRAAGLVHILQFDGAERMARLAAFADAHPDFAPVHALLAIELGEDRQNAQTIDEMRREQAAIARFLGADREGRLVSYFLDQSVLALWLDRAHKREAILNGFFAGGRDRVSVQFMRSNAGWMGAVSLPEAATALEYRVGNSGDFRGTGLLQAIDPRSGRPMPNPGFELPAHQGPVDIALRYVDLRGVQSAATIIAFDPGTALRRGMRDILERTSNAWLAYGTGQNGQHLYFTHLVSYRCAIAKVEIGFNGDAPSEVLTLPPCDPANPYAVPSAARPFITLKAGVESASIRLTFSGGDISEIRTFPRPK